MKVYGEVDIHSAPRLHALLGEVETGLDGSPHIVVDLSEVTFMDSTGLGVLIRGRNEMRERRRDLRIVAGEGAVTRLLNVTRLDEAFSVYPDLGSAMEEGRCA
jgi:anti-sigma B factor antagonist